MPTTTTTTMIDLKRVLRDAPIVPSFAVKDLDSAHEFYGTKLGLNVQKDAMGVLEIHGRGDQAVLVYPKPNHQPAAFTVLNLEVRDIDAAVDGLIDAGIKMEHYNGENGVQTDAKGVARGDKQGEGPSIAWFRDPSGNILSVMEGQSS
jgi:catechol 2,3-dioxygenase-like lactoylglutathione lyase family enzyme